MPHCLQCFIFVKVTAPNQTQCNPSSWECHRCQVTVLCLEPLGVHAVWSIFCTSFDFSKIFPSLPSLNLEINGWKMKFLLAWPIFRGELLVSGRVNHSQNRSHRFLCFFAFWIGECMPKHCKIFHIKDHHTPKNTPSPNWIKRKDLKVFTPEN